MSQSHRFGNVEVRPAERALLIDGQLVDLGARAFDLLEALIVHRDRVVTKDELLEIVWPGLVVEENNLQVHTGNGSKKSIFLRRAKQVCRSSGIFLMSAQLWQTLAR